MNINDLTIGQMKEILSLGGVTKKELPFEIGKSYLIRTVTLYQVGRVFSICGDFVELECASWIGDTGRYHDCLLNGVFKEVEPYPLGVAVNCSAIIDRAPWPHDLPTEQKP